MKKIIGLVLLCILLVGCRNDSDQNEKLITKEYLIETCQLSEEEFAGVNLDDFIKAYSLTEKSLPKIDVRIVLNNYRGKLNEKITIDEDAIFYQYIREKDRENTQITEDELTNEIEVVALCIAKGMTYKSVIVDYKKEIIYYGIEEDLLYDGSVPNWSVELDEEKKQILQNMWEDCEILLWEQRYDGEDDGSTESYSWGLYFELADGKVKKYQGGYQGNIFPEGYDIMLSTLYQWNVELVPVDFLKRFFENEDELEGVDLRNFIKENMLTFDKVWEVDLQKLLEDYKQTHND